MRGIIPLWLPIVLVGRDVAMLILITPKLRKAGYGVALPVHFLGKAATFNLLYAFPLLLLGQIGEDHKQLMDIGNIFGWAFVGWGTALYLLAGGMYFVQAQRLTRVTGAPTRATPAPAVLPVQPSRARMATMPAQQDRAPRRTPPRRPDASMSLLTGLLTETLDPAYAEAAARRKAGAGTLRSRARGWHRNLSPTVLLGVAAIALVLVVAAIQTQRAAPQVERERQQLISRIQEADRLASTDQSADRRRPCRAPGRAGRRAGPLQRAGQALRRAVGVHRRRRGHRAGHGGRLSDAPGAVSPSGGDIRQQGRPTSAASRTSTCSTR